jgi:hypothetical protein
LTTSSKSAARKLADIAVGFCYYDVFYHIDDNGQAVIDNVIFLGCDDGFVPPFGLGTGIGTGIGSPPPYKPGCATMDQTAARQMYAHYNDALVAAKENGGTWEWAGYIYQDQTTGNFVYYDVGLLQLSGNSGNTGQIPSPPAFPNLTLAAWYHVHPDTYTWDGGNGVDANGTHFSSDDINVTATLGITGYVAEYNDVGPRDTTPSIQVAEESFQWYSWNAAEGEINAVSGMVYDISKGTLTTGSGC